MTNLSQSRSIALQRGLPIMFKDAILRAATTLIYSLFIWFVAAPAFSQQATVLRNATLIDGTGAAPREHVDVILRDGLIEGIVPASSTKHSGDRVVDCTGKTIIPGLISAHSHLGVLENNAVNTATAYN